jgi:heat shock protein HtpX
MTESEDSSVVRLGAVEFQSPRGPLRARGKLWFNSVYFLALGAWAVIGSWHQHRVLGFVAGFVYLELTLAVFRSSRLVGGVLYNDELAGRIAPLLEDLCTKAVCLTPKVVIRDDAMRAACVRRSRGRLLLVLSGSYLDRVDDRELRAVLAHEVVHIARDDLHWVKVRIWGSLVFAGAGCVAVLALFGGGVTLPVYGATAILTLMVANVGLSTFNRRLERRADMEGASLCDDPIALASALRIAKAFSDEARQRLFGPRPWRWILSPVSWRMPTHPPMSDRIHRLRELAAIRPLGGVGEPSDPLPGNTQVTAPSDQTGLPPTAGTEPYLR